MDSMYKKQHNQRASHAFSVTALASVQDKEQNCDLKMDVAADWTDKDGWDALKR